jgi:hypothetical protein
MVPSTVRTSTVVGLAAEIRLPPKPAAMGSTSQTRKRSLSPVLSISHYPQVYGNQIPSPDIMTYSTDVKQILLSVDGKLDYIIHLITGNGHKSINEIISTYSQRLHGGECSNSMHS